MSHMLMLSDWNYSTGESKYKILFGKLVPFGHNEYHSMKKSVLVMLPLDGEDLIRNGDTSN